MQTPMAPQKRHLTLLFSDLSQSMKLSQSLDFEILAAVIGRIQEAFVSIIPRHGGVVSQVQGDGVYAVFGLGFEEDAGRRAVEAGLELHAVVRDLDFSHLSPQIGTLHLHSGVHSGLTHVTGGDEVRGTVSVMADAVNVAHRLASAAEPDQLLVSEISLGADRHFFYLDPLRSVELRGVPEPLAAFPVLGLRRLPSRFHSRLERSGRLVGREGELEEMMQAFANAQRGIPQVVSIVAPAGSGKTRLAEAFLNHLSETSNGEAAELVVLRGYCEALSGPRSTLPLQQMSAQLLDSGLDLPEWLQDSDAQERTRDHLARVAPGLESHVEALVDFLQSRSPDETDTAEQLIDIAEVISRTRTLVLFIDDWQWADDLTRSVLRPLRSFEQGRLLLLRTSREHNETAAPGERVIQLGPLKGAQSGALIEDLAPDAGPFVVREIQAASGGNPLFIEELCHAVRHGRSLTDITRGREVAIYNSLHMLIESRVAVLDSTLATVLRDLSVLGDGAPGWLVAEVLAHSDVDGALEQLSDMDFVYAAADGQRDTSVRFKHGIARDVVYSLTTIGTRLRVHTSAVEAIEARYPVNERDTVAELLAYHSAGTEAYQRTADYAEVAGNKALNAAIMDRSRTHYERALDALVNVLDEPLDDSVFDQWIRICRNYAQACLFDAQPEQLRYFEIGARLSSEVERHEAAAEMHYWLAYLNYTLGQNRRALHHVELAFVACDESKRPWMHVQLRSLRGQVRVMQCEHSAAVVDLDAAISAQRESQRRSSMAYPLGYGLAVKGMSLGQRGRFAEANSHFEEAGEVLGDKLHQIQASVVTMHAGSLLWQGEWEQGLEQARRGIWLADRLASQYIMASSSALAAYARWRMGEEAQALEQMDTAIATARRGREVLWMSMHFSWYAEMLMSAERGPEARSALGWALSRSRQGEHLSDAFILCLLATLRGSPRAERYLRRAERVAEAHDSDRERLLVIGTRLRLNLDPNMSQDELNSAYCELGMFGYAAY